MTIDAKVESGSRNDWVMVYAFLKHATPEKTTFVFAAQACFILGPSSAS